MFDRMKIVEYIYEFLVETSYKKPTREDANRAGHSRNKRVEVSPYKTHPETGEITDKHRKIYLDFLKRESRTCLIHGPGH